MSVVKESVERFQQNVPWWATIIGFVLLIIIHSNIRDYIAYKRSGASRPRLVSDGWYGFKIVYLMMKMQQEGELPDYIYDRFHTNNINTLRCYTAGSEIISTREPENIKAVLGTQFNDFVLGIRHKQFNILLGEGIFTLDGGGWKHSRAMLRPQFAREQVGHVELLEPHIQALARNIRNAQGQQFDLQPLFFKLTIDTGTEFLFGESCSSLDEDIDNDVDGPAVRRQFPEAFNRSQSYLFYRANMQKFYWLAMTPEFKKCNRIVHEFGDYYVNKALRATPEEVEKFSRGGYVFLYELLKETRNPKTLRDQSLNILLAARDTTAGLLSFLFYELARHPDVFHKLREEIVSTFGEDDEVNLKDLTFESLKKLEYLKWVLNETLRLYPSVPQNFRVATKNTTLPRGGGENEDEPIYVRKGQTVVYSIYSTHRKEDIYGKDATEWRPERWADPALKKVGWGFLPFNGGPRICLGQQFALTEASYTTVRLLQIFKNIKSFTAEERPLKKTHLTMSVNEGTQISLY